MANKTKDIPLSGKVITDRNAATIGANFQQCTNMRYTDTHPKGIRGMSEVNATALTNAKIRSGFHYRKEQPAESHVLVQSLNAGETSSSIYDNTAVVPAAADFSATTVLDQATGFDVARFSTAPNNNMAMCDKSGAYVWGGNEKLCSSFITSSATVTDSITDPRDYTQEVTNTLSTAAEVAVIGGGNDADCKLLLSCDEADGGTLFTDTSVGGGGHVTTPTNAETDTSQKKFGISSGYFSGTNSVVAVANSADFVLGTGLFTVDTWIRLEALPGSGDNYTIFSQYQDSENSQRFTIYNATGTYKLWFYQEVANSDIITWAPAWTTPPVINRWYHIALIRGWGGAADAFAITVDGELVATTTSAALDLVDVAGADLEIGAYNSTNLELYGWVDEFRWTQGATRWESAFTPPARAYSAVSQTWLVGATRPLKGVKFYIGDANTEASTMTTKEWNGSSWTTLTSATNTWVDNTAASSITLAQTATVTWDTTESTSKIKYLNGQALYWYQFAIDAGSATIYHCTVDAAMQPVKDIWDGVERTIASFQVYDAGLVGYADETIAVFSDNYVSTNTGTYAKIVLLATTTEWLLVGFPERMMGINISIVTAEGVIKGNAVAATTLTVSSWDGASWSERSGVSDGTSANSISLAESGTISWQPPDKGEEFTQEISNNPPLYYYKLSFDKTLSDDVQIYYITGIPAQKTINAYSFPIHAGNSLWLCSEQDGDKNKMIRSLLGTASVFNGDGFSEFYVGDESEVMAGAVIYSQLGSNLYEVLVVCKKSETYILVPTSEGIETFLVAGHIGCVAPATMKSLTVGDVQTGLHRNVCMWQGAEGVYLFDGRSPVRISDDIQDIFDDSKFADDENSTGINKSYLHVSYGFFDIENYSYHWVFASGSATVPDAEWVFDIKRQKWFNIDRGTGNDLMGGFEVQSTIGAPYTYGFDNSGQAYRLENGTSFDGADIVHTLHTGDGPLENTIMVETKLRKVNLVCGATNTTTNTITASYYSNGSTTATGTVTLVPQASGKTIARTGKGVKQIAAFHSLKLEMTTDDETTGFEPMYLGVEYLPIRNP